MTPAVIRLFNKVGGLKAGQTVSEADYDLLATGNVDVFKPDGERLCCVRRGVVSLESREKARPVLRLLRSTVSLNRGVAAGARSVYVRSDGALSNTSVSKPVHSSIIGFFDRYPRAPFCRQTAFNADHAPEFVELMPMLGELAACFQATAPERFKSQMVVAAETSPDFVIRGTPWTTITVNHNWATMLHTDKGDLPEGFSCLAVLRQGSYRGSVLTFPAFRLGVDLRDGDFIMMDAHEWHANTPFLDVEEGFERISCVLYYRTKMRECGTAAEELERAKMLRGDLHDEPGAE